MIFNHFTTLSVLNSIRRKGLNRGEVPLSDRRVVRAVSLTTDPSPHGHGLDMGEHVVTDEEAALSAAKGFPIAAGTVFADKRDVRITLKLPSSDRALKQWRPWSRRHCEQDYPERLERAAGPKNRARTWWLYFGTIPPETFVDVEVLKPEEE